MTAWRPLLALPLAALAGCGHPHPPPDPLLRADLVAAIPPTLAAMGRPPLAARALEDQAVQLAWATDPARIQAIRAGTLRTTALAAQADDLLRRLARDHLGQPPLVLAYLTAQARRAPASLDLATRELLEATRAQAALEMPAGP